MRSFFNPWIPCAAVLGAGLAVCLPSSASDAQAIYRCGHVYTNHPDPALNCKPLTGGNVTVITGTRVQSHSAVAPSANVSGVAANSSGVTSNTKVDSADQRQRDTQAQAVLQAELQRAQLQQAELLREWNNGEPERRADELRQAPKYQERVAQLRSALQRVSADVAGLQRELARLGTPTTTPTAASTVVKP